MQNTTKKTGKKIHGTPNNREYIELLEAFPPRIIKTEDELDITQQVIDSLIDRDNLTSDEREYLHLLGLLVSEYEEKHHPIPDIYGVDLLKVLIEERNLLQKDLVPIFKTESIISAILNGKRQLTAAHIQKLADFFQVSPAVFFENKQYYIDRASSLGDRYNIVSNPALKRRGFRHKPKSPS